MNSLTEFAQQILPTNTQAVELYAKEPTPDNLIVLKNIVIENSKHAPGGGMQSPIGNWGASGFVGCVKALVDQGTVPNAESLMIIHQGWFEADWRRRSWMNSPEGQAKLKEYAEARKAEEAKKSE